VLRFQPVRRPQLKQPSKPKPSFPKVPPGPGQPATSTSTSGGNRTSSAVSTGLAPPPRSTLADWAATEDDEYFYAEGEKRQRGGRRKKRKKADNAPAETDWDELYDPSRPTNVEEYLRSEERIREVLEWKAILYARRRRKAPSYDSDTHSDEEEEEEEEERPTSATLWFLLYSLVIPLLTCLVPDQFAPPPSLSYAPPPMSPPRIPAVAEAATGDGAYARRMALSGMAHTSKSLSPQPSPAKDDATISRAPVRYEAPPVTPEDDKMDLDEDDDGVDYSNIPLPPPFTEGDEAQALSSSNRPGQAGFAQRLMAKYGWTKGSGLGAGETGMTTALRVQVEKRRRRPDAEGGGFAEPGGRGKIIAGKGANNKGGSNEGGRFGKMSEVIVLRNMLHGMPDLAAEIEAGLGQEIGEECGDKYGRVERLYIEPTQRLVFIKFTDQVSALRVSRNRVMSGY